MPILSWAAVVAAETGSVVAKPSQVGRAEEAMEAIEEERSCQGGMGAVAETAEMVDELAEVVVVE